MINDKEIIQEFIFVENPHDERPIIPIGFDISPCYKIADWNPKLLRIHVCVISWDGPHTPVPTWELAAELPEDSSEEEIQASIVKLLNRKKYFKACNKCNERNPVGWMYSSNRCMECASKYDNVIY